MARYADWSRTSEVRQETLRRRQVRQERLNASQAADRTLRHMTKPTR